MNDDETADDVQGYDFGRLCRVFRAWYDQHGYSQSRIEEAGGPSGPIITKLYNATWTSARPRAIADKIDRGFGWPSGTAWTVLVRSDWVAAANTTEERALRATLRNAAAAAVRRGPNVDRRLREGERAAAELERFHARDTAQLVAHISATVGGQGHSDRSYVEAPGDRAEDGEHGDETAAAIRAMREELRELAKREREVFERLNAMSTRLERWEIERAKSLDRPEDET